ncbi:uncharacterized protein G2W53_026694 [Senna tora]|uniref:Helitron helicase-like domain-containing protein n=1 Tax=Senna tora TaxID=362788 RepID=A0A834WLK2_9FABA|nr:uncharacterized protein G2W53_026694 [Senna tora]
MESILRFDFADQIFSTISGPTNRPVFSYIHVEFEGSLAIICAELQGTEIVRYITMQLMYDAKSQQYWWPVLVARTPVHEYVDIGLSTYECEHYGAIFWYEERINKSRNTKKPKFSLCCLQGKVQLPKRRDPPKILENLLVNNDSRSKQFRRRIRTYNNMFAFTSMGGRIDNSANDGRGPYVFRLHGQNMHLIGDLLPKADETLRFSQLYIYDTNNEVINRMRNASSSASEDPCDASIVMQLSQMLDSINPLVKVFRSVKDHPSLSFRDSLRLKLIKKRTTDARIYNLPAADEIAALIVGDFDPENVERDIIVEERSGTLQRIDELHPLYLPMQYPLMFPRGEDGYRQDVLFRFADFNSNKKEKTLTLRQYFTYNIQDRPSQFNICLRCGKLTQQFIVDGYTMIESQRLLYIRLHQKELRANSYVTLTHALSRGETTSSNIGKMIVLPSSFTRSERPDLLSHVFKIKLNALIKDITKEFLFGICRADIYTIEFQKRGLPHAHILIWLNAEHK